MIKKLISAVAAAAIAITAFAGLASAEKTYDIRLGSGVTYTDSVDSYGSPYFTVWCDDLAGEYTSTMQIQIEVISGEIGTDVSNFEFGVVGGLDSKRGLYTPGRSKTYLAGTAFTQNVTTTDGKQFINVSWGSSAPAMTDDGMLFEFYVTPKDAAADLEFEINGINLVNTCTSTNGDKVNHFFEPETAPQYVLKAGTSMVSEKSSATPTPTATATPTPTPVVTPEPTATVEPTPEVTPEPTTGKGAITADANDAAAWAWKTAAAAGSSVKVTVNANGEPATKAFALKAAVDGTVKVGVIVQYNPTTFTSFEITDIVVE